MPSALRISALTKYFGSNAALQGVDLDVAEGEVYGLLGPNEVIPATLKWDESGKKNTKGGMATR